LTRRSTFRLRAYVVAGICGLVAAMALGEPASALAAVPLLVLAVAGMVGVEAVDVDVDVTSFPTSIVEGEERTVELAVRSSRPLRGLNLDLAPGPGVVVADVAGGRLVGGSAVTLDVAGETNVTVTLRAEGWGRRSLGPVVAYADGPLGMIELVKTFEQTVRMVSVPSDVLVNEMLAPRDTNLHAGDLVSRLRGIGSEFAELRQYSHGDDPRAINWRVSARSGSWWVNERHPERNGDVVLVVDAQTQEGTGADVLVDRGVRLAGALLREYGRRRYRLGLVTVDGVARWIQPGSGEGHRRRLLEQLLGVQGGDTSRAAIERAVLRVAKTPALVILLTPMLDDSLAGIAHQLRVSGLDVALVEIDPVTYLPEPTSQVRAVGRRLWRMERERLRDLLAGDGIPVAPWRAGDPPDVPLTEIAARRTSWRMPV
jgi:uncharacterized protein (DUF58 family)